MSKKPGKTVVTHRQAIVTTTCFITAFLPFTAIAADSKLAEVSNNLQAIFNRIHQKYDAHDVQQAELAAQVKAKPPAETPSLRQNTDTPSSGFSDASSTPSNIPSSASDSRFAPGEELILTASANTIELASIFAIKSEHGLRIGLGDFLQILEFPIYITPNKVAAEGWFLSESNHFSLNRLSDGRLEIKTNGNSYYVAAKDYEVKDDIFVELDDVARWFDLSYKLNEEQLALAISSKTKFPAELRLARQGNTGTKNFIASKSVMPLKESEYKIFSPPMLDIQTWAQQAEQVIPPAPLSTGKPQTTKSTSANYSILANHDLAYFNTELFLAGNRDFPLNSARLTMSRQSDDAELLGPLHATEYAFGDVVPVNAGFGSTQAISRGFSLDNTPINQLADNRKVNITGPIQTGWDAELYRNGVLIEQRMGLSDGRYEFNDIELEFGNNDFKLIFYGPQGQMETKTESYVVDSNNVTAGQGMYRFSLVEVGKSVFNVDPIVDDPTQQGTMASTVLDYGITDWLAINAGSATFAPKLGATKQFVTLGTNASFGNAGLFSARFMEDKDRLHSTDYNYRTRVLNTSLSLDYTNTKQQDQLTSVIKSSEETRATMTGQLFPASWLPISYQNAWRRLDEKEQNTREESFQNTLGIGSRIGYFSNSLIWHDDISEDPLLPGSMLEEKHLDGSFQYRKNFGRLSTRLFSSYAVKPTNELYSYGGIFTYNWSQAFNTEVKYSYFNINDQYQVSLGLNWRKDAFYFTTDASYNKDGSWAAGIGLRFSLGYEPIEHSIFTSARPISQSGAVAVRVFEDLNMNGIYDQNERPIENATVKAVQAYRQEKTNDSGVAVISSIYNDVTTDVVVDESTLDGPFMITAIPGMAIKARKGYVEKLDLPVVKAGELEGVIYLKDQAGNSNPAPYITINLIDKNDKSVATARSEFDGYYLFTKVKPGNYRLQVDENYVERRDLKVAEKKLDFSSNGDVIEGVDFVLRPLDEAAGFVANAGHFDSPNMLKLYYSILRHKMGGKFIQTPFYIKLPDKGGYVLGLAYFKGDPVTGKEAQQNAQQACVNLAQKNIYCDVQYQNFKY